jgi:type II secretory pathway component PulJ
MITKLFPMIITRRCRAGFTLKQRGCSCGFTLAELLVSVFVLALIIFMVAQMMSSAAAITRPASKHIDTDTQARTVFDRMAADFGHMLKRTDIDYWLKQQGSRYYPGHSFGHSQGRGRRPPRTQQGSDQIAFFSQVPGYNASSGLPSPISLVGYRVNTTSYQMERMGKNLIWNSTPPPGSNNPQPMVFLPLEIDDTWPTATNTNSDSDYEVIGPGVFRVEYYYLLKNGKLSDNPWYNSTNTSDPAKLNPPHTLTNFLTDVEAIVVTVAVIDPASRSLLPDLDQNMNDLIDAMEDFQTQNGRAPVRTGVIEEQWNSVVTDAVSNGWIPPEAAKAIRIYSRYFELKTL